MSRYIDADKLIEYLKKMHGDRSEHLKIYALSEIINMIASQSTADVEEVRHGKWIYRGHNGKMEHAFECSVCERWMFTDFPKNTLLKNIRIATVER